MEQVKVALLGLLVVLGGYNIYQTSQTRSSVEELWSNVNIKLNDIAKAPAANPVTPPANVPPVNVQNNLPTTTPEVPAGPTTTMSFSEEVHEFGTVEVDSENLYAFEFTNTGSEPLVISNAKGSCGCTVPQWPKEPIMPGKTGIIDVKYTPNAGQAGQKIEKVVTVTANTSPANTMVRIKADVAAK